MINIYLFLLIGSSTSSTESSVPSTAELLPTNDDNENRSFSQGKIIRRFAPVRATSGTGMKFYIPSF